MRDEVLLVLVLLWLVVDILNAALARWDRRLAVEIARNQGWLEGFNDACEQVYPETWVRTDRARLADHEPPSVRGGV